MTNRQQQLLGGNRAGERRIDVAGDNDPIGRLVDAQRLIGDHHGRGLLRVAAAAGAEIVVRLRQGKIAKEGVRHVRVVVLTGVNENRPAPALLAQRMPQRRHFHEIGPRCDDEMDGEQWLCGPQDGRPTPAASFARHPCAVMPAASAPVPRTGRQMREKTRHPRPAAPIAGSGLERRHYFTLIRVISINGSSEDPPGAAQPDDRPRYRAGGGYPGGGGGYPGGGGGYPGGGGGEYPGGGGGAIAG